MLLVTGGAGFIGSNFVIDWFESQHDQPQEGVLNLDLLTYAGHPENLSALAHNRNHQLVHGDIADPDLVTRLLAEYPS
jgi:dTDP-glucose 4,6-dehydratase